MIKTGHLGKYEVFALVVISAVADMFLSVPQEFSVYGASAAWMIPILSMIFCLGIWQMIVPVLAKRRNEDIISLTEHHLGKWGTATAVLVVAVMLLVDTASTMRIFTEAVVATVLPRTPISVVAIPFLLVLIYYAYWGIEGISRVSWFLLSWLLLGMALLLVLNINWINLEYIFPLWGQGFTKLMWGGWFATGLFKNILFISFLSSLLRQPEDVRKIGFWSIITIGASYTLVTLVFTMVFSPETAMRSPFPLYQLGRLIFIGRFIQRLEAGFVFIWAAMALIELAFELWLLTYLIGWVFRMPVNRPLVFPFAVIIYSMSFLARNYSEMLTINSQFLLKWKWVIDIVLPLLVLLWVRLRSGKGERDNEQTAQAS